jgi:cyclopropane fatty-acyl-phospholipid synthase-like methyltransferase
MEASTVLRESGRSIQQLKKLRRHPIRAFWYLFRWAEFRLRPAESEDKLRKDAEQYWNAPSTELLNQYSHWRGAGIFADDDLWLALGRKNLELYQQFCHMMGVTKPPRRIVEWGCGGGANAVHFAPLAETYVGIDIARPSLRECASQLEAAGFHNFEPVLVDAGAPETALTQIEQKCDLLLSTYVFEVFPTPEYGLQVLKIARKLLNEGGMAIIQVRYIRDSWRSRPKRFAYKRNFTSNAYRVETFWDEAEKCGFLPQAVRLVPQDKLNNNTNYAYFILTT